MGLILRRWDKYEYKDNLHFIKFKRGEPVFGIPVEVEKALREKGYFHYVPEEGRPIPQEVTQEDKNTANMVETKEDKEEKFKNMRDQLISRLGP